jgi:hypothetical protein
MRWLIMAFLAVCFSFALTARTSAQSQTETCGDGAVEIGRVADAKGGITLSCRCLNGYTAVGGECKPSPPRAIVPNLAADPDAARRSAAQLRLVDDRIASLKKAIDQLGDSNPEWARERERALDDSNEAAVSASIEGVNLLTLGFAEYMKSMQGARVEAARMSALAQTFTEPLANLSADEARLNQVLAMTKNPELANAVIAFKATMQRLRDARDANDIIAMTARTRDAIEELNSAFEIGKLEPTTHNAYAGLYRASATLGGLAIVFVAEGTPAAAVAAIGSAASSVVVGGTALVNVWQERDQLAALDQNASSRNRLRVELMGRLTDLQQQRDSLAMAVQRSAK